VAISALSTSAGSYARSLNFLKVPASVSDTARLAVLLASDRVRMMTGQLSTQQQALPRISEPQVRGGRDRG
jgi:hypothetical protein